ncbi:hypothetical protein GQ600_21895 [Phytophthora cactorum]|nr:hypothetical protein GQ600_21895 [Phytophthora cactorum]
MWKACSARFAAAEGRCKLSGSHDGFWDFVSKRQKQDDRRDSNDAVAILTNEVSKLVETEAASNKEALIEEKTAVARLAREKMQRDVLVEKLAAVDGIIARRRQALPIIHVQIHD